MKSGFTARPSLPAENRSSETTRHNSPTMSQAQPDHAFDPKDTARLHIPQSYKSNLSTRVFETLQESNLPSISEELSDEDHTLSYLTSAVGFFERDLTRKTQVLNELEDTLTQQTSQLADHESELDSRLDSLEQCQRVYVASTELAKDQLLRSRALLQSVSKADSKVTGQISTLKASNRTMTKAKSHLAATNESFEAFYRQFKEEKAAFMEELEQFNREKSQLLEANEEMQRNQSQVDAKLQLISTRLQEISKIRTDFNQKYTKKKRTLAEKEQDLAAREQDLRTKQSQMESRWAQFEVEWKLREEKLRAREQELQRKIAQCDELLSLKDELDREKESVRQREVHASSEIRRKDAELEHREKQLEVLSQELELQREVLASESVYTRFRGRNTDEAREQLEMMKEDVISAGMRLELFENWLVTREETLHEIDTNLNKERLEIDSTARMLESLHHELETAKSDVSVQREATLREQATLDREKLKIEAICRELERQRLDLETKEKSLDTAARRLKERERALETSEKALIQHEKVLQRHEGPVPPPVDYSQLDQELRCKRIELKQERERISKAKEELKMARRSPESPRAKWLDTDSSRAELRRINQMLQESYLTPRGVMTPLSAEVSPAPETREASE